MKGITPRTMVFAWDSVEEEKAGDKQIVGEEWAPRYYHIRTPVRTKSNVMYRYDLIGYSYGLGQPLDLTWVGYPYKGDGKNHQSSAIDRNPSQIPVIQYFKDDLLYLRFGPISRHCNGFELLYQGRKSPSEGLRGDY